MALSRRAPWLWLALGGAPATGQIPIDYSLPPSPQPALRTELRLDCPRGSSDEEIVVCGDRDADRRFRVAPSEPVPGARRRLIAGELPRGADALADGALSRCSTTGPHVQCGGGLDVFGVVFGIARLIAKARANRD